MFPGRTNKPSHRYDERHAWLNSNHRRRRPFLKKAAWVLHVTLLAGVSMTIGAVTSPRLPGAMGTRYVTNQILVMPRTGIDPAALANFHSRQGARVVQSFEGIRGLQTIQLAPMASVPAMISRYEQSGLVEFAEPDYFGQVLAAPNDPRFLDGTLWGLGVIDAPEAWDVLSSASNIVVAVVDTGVRYTHEDLASNMWVNLSDNSHGTNALAGTTDPSDDSGHGTQVAGILGAVGNNGKGVTGVAWHTQLMACKSFDNFGIGNLSATIACLDYARIHGANIINASWGFNPGSLALSNAVYSLRSAGIIVVAAAGNTSVNIDVTPSYPATYNLDNIVSVAYTTRADTLATNSNYGATNVDLAAPGENIYSTFGATDTFYLAGTGSSFAAPYVTGAFALLLAKFPSETHQQIINRLLIAADPLPSLAGKCVTGGRLNLRNALNPPLRLTTISQSLPFQVRLAAGPSQTCVLEVSSNLTTWTPAFTNITSTNGTFDFTDNQGGQSLRFYRATTAR